MHELLAQYMHDYVGDAGTAVKLSRPPHARNYGHA